MAGLRHGFGLSRRRSVIGGVTQMAGTGMRFGQQQGYDAGTDGTVFVDAIAGDDSADGLTLATAKATLAGGLAAANAAGGDQVMRLVGDGVRYREGQDFIWTNPALNSLAIKGFGTDRPVISGAEILSGWVPCTASDSDVVGANWPSIFKTTVQTADFTAPKYWRTLLSENGAPLTICGIRRPGRTTPDFFADNIDQTIAGDDTPEGADLAFGLRSGIWYNTIQNPSVLSSYTDAQLSQTVAVLHAFPNEARFMEVTSAAGQVLQLETANFRPAGGGTNGAYALLNVLPTIKSGEWGYQDNADGTVTFFVWPSDPANLASKMELAVRSEGMRIYRAISNCHLVLEGVNFEMFAGGGLRDQAFGIDGNLNLTGNTSAIRQCRFSLYAAGSGLRLKFAEQATIVEDVTFSDGIGFGLSTVPGSSNPLMDYRIRRCLAADLSQTGFRMFGIQYAVMQDCKSIRTSGGGHANLINFYQRCDMVVCQNFQGGVTHASRAYEGYGTNQSSSRLYFLHCTFTPGSDSRAYVDQNISGEILPTPEGGGHLINCWVPHMPDRVGSEDNGAITVGRDIMSWDIYNCVTPAIINTGGSLTRKGNVLTNSTSVADPSETLASIEDLQVNVAASDFRATTNSILKTRDGEDVASFIAELEDQFPDVDLRRDSEGRNWDPSRPGTGPYGLQWPSQ
ncbi:MAG: hypothetical protein AAF697_10230 [Pseudomonadota bacterium]